MYIGHQFERPMLYLRLRSAEVWLSRQKIQCWSYIPVRLGKILCQFCTSEEVELLVTDSATDAKMIDSPQKSGFSVAIVKKRLNKESWLARDRISLKQLRIDKQRT